MSDTTFDRQISFSIKNSLEERDEAHDEEERINVVFVAEAALVNRARRRQRRTRARRYRSRIGRY